ncbi:hypothetical protein PGH07_02250 [Sulfurovum sp. zt1-1]|uniref:Uncharacterized protein n=1 Tax=Sulfurovum zhangzhouensis TaxID=3019067 RepID=A0ABT7QVX1_9BACT|nr:hypothetical protein [Sulfurovum zhangzhouensis]MDM5270993.1 hypothetical protein [Sulfurovum zhangzhouensis]
MKKITLVMLLVLGLASSLSAHHMAQYEDAGIYIDEDSPHLLMTFY